jgi:hypothetical protein
MMMKDHGDGDRGEIVDSQGDRSGGGGGRGLIMSHLVC